MKTPAASVLFFLMASLLGAAGQFLYKAGADRAGGSLASYIANGRILAGAACYVAVMALFVAAFRRGGSPAVLYPVYATTFIWAALMARFLHGTPIHGVHVLGMAFLVAGMFLMGR
jgi:drug/metabolite transporter (DMT)-like permease